MDRLPYATWLAPLLLASIAIAGTWALVVALRWAQRALTTGHLPSAEEDYLSRLIAYIRDLHVRGAFDEGYFITRELHLTNHYRARSFFISSHRTILARIGTAGSITSKTPTEGDGYYTRDLYGEALAGASPVIILGEPGSGKSVSARQLALEASVTQLSANRPDGRLPIFISLSEYVASEQGGRTMPFYPFVKSLLLSHGSASTMPSRYIADNFDGLLASGRLLFILDSIDEMPAADFENRCTCICDFIAKYGTSRFLLTCRSNEFIGQIPGREAYLDRLKPREIYHIILRRRGTLSSWTPRELYDKLTDTEFALSPFASNPFYLNLLINYASLKHDLPDNIPMLLYAVCEDWATREIAKAKSRSINSQHAGGSLCPQVLLRRLGDVAFAISNSAGSGAYISLSAVQAAGADRAAPGDPADWVLDIAARGGMLTLDREKGQVRFVHHKLQEYFAADYLDRSLASDRLGYDSVPAICDSIWWDEVILILCSITRHPTRIIEQLLAAPPPAGGDPGAAASSGPAGSRRVVLPLSHCWLMARSLRLLTNAEHKPEDATEQLVGRVIASIDHRLSSSPSISTFIDCTRALSEIDDERAVSLLMANLESSSKLERELAFAALIRTTSGRAFLASHVHRIGPDVYLRRRYGAISGRHARNIRTIRFDTGSTRLWLAFYAATGFLSRYRYPAILLASAAALYSLFLGNVYMSLCVSTIVLFDACKVRLLGLDPPRLAYGLPPRGIVLASLSALALLGCLTPPFLVAPSLAVTMAMAGMCIYMTATYHVACISYSQVLSAGVGPSRGPALFWRLYLFVLPRLVPLLIQASAEIQDRIGSLPSPALLRLGLITHEQFVESSIEAMGSIEAFVSVLQSGDYKGLEFDFLSIIENYERRVAQAESAPLVLRLSPPREATRPAPDEAEPGPAPGQDHQPDPIAREFCAAVMATFTLAELEHEVRLALAITVSDHVHTGAAFSVVVLNLYSWAQRTDRLNPIVAALAAARPQSKPLLLLQSRIAGG